MAHGRDRRHALVSELRIYFEGDDRLRPGISLFFSGIAEAARRNGWRFAPPVATYGRPAQAFRIALQTHSNAWNVLLLDWEDPDEAETRRKHLENCDQDSVFWMVQVMEAWLLADIDALKRFYDGGFQESALRGNPKVEEIPKDDVLKRLKKATSGTKSGEYQKNHAFKLLELIDPAKVKKASPNCERLFSVILANLR
jgi:hypothetical protein